MSATRMGSLAFHKSILSTSAHESHESTSKHGSSNSKTNRLEPQHVKNSIYYIAFIDIFVTPFKY